MENRSKQGARMQNLELLRCVAMMMVAVLHYLGKGNLLADLAGEELGSMGITAWLVESFCIVAVNVYMFISGYFLSMSDFKVSRLIQLWLQIWTYSVAFGLLGAAAGWLEETSFDTHYLLTLFFPVSMGHYWFMTAYVFLYLLLPFVGLAVKKMTKQQLQVSIVLLFIVFSVLKSVLPIRLEMDAQGYDCLWYLCVFLAAAYVRRFGVPLLKKRSRCLALYVICCLLGFGVTMALHFIYLDTGSLGRRLTMCMEYNHILPFFAAAGLFGVFMSLKVTGAASRVVGRIAPCTLGVYLLHENLGLRYAWQRWLGAERLAGLAAQESGGLRAAGELVLWTALAAACIFVCGILVEIVRKFLFEICHKGLLHIGIYRRLTEGIERADRIFRS